MLLIPMEYNIFISHLIFVYLPLNIQLPNHSTPLNPIHLITLNQFITSPPQQTCNKMKPQDNRKPQLSHEKDNKSFMLKFKDKHSVISKQGLLKLLEKKPKIEESKTEKPKPVEQEIINIKSQDKLVEKKKIQEIIKARSLRKGSDVSVSKSVQLPQINPKQHKITKSVSTSLNLRKQVSSSPGPKIQTDSIPRPAKKPPSSLFQVKPKKPVSGYNFQLDQFALDHLDFLDKFQERIKKRQVASPQPN